MTTAPRRSAVVGRPIAHSRSPQIHRAFAAQFGFDLAYERVEAAEDGFAATLDGLRGAGFAGCNVTLPFKFEAFALAARCSGRATLAGACNALRPLAEGDGWEGDNTDGDGLLRDIETNAGLSLAGARVLLLGAGGSAAGALGPFARSGAAEVVVANRTMGRAERLVAAMRERLAGAGAAPGEETASATRVATWPAPRRDESSAETATSTEPLTVRVAAAAPGDPRRTAVAALRAAPLDACGVGFDVVVNATASSVAGAELPVDARALRRGALAVDLMYGPAARPFLAWAERHGATGRDGLGMLVEQAADAFVFFHGVARPETESVLAALRAELSGA